VQPAPVKPTVTFSQFEALDVRVGTIESVEGVPTSRKLVRFVVNSGDHNRTVIASVKQESDDLDALVGLQTLFVVNLEPRAMAGKVSEVMFFHLGHTPAGARRAGTSGPERDAGRLRRSDRSSTCPTWRPHAPARRRPVRAT
jgi:tRNA-binding protein